MTDSPREASPDPTAAISERVLEEQVAAINAHDVPRLAATYAEDAVIRDPQYREPLRGRAGVENDASVFFAAFPDLHAEVTYSLVNGETIAAEMTLVGTHTGPLTLASGQVPPTGRSLRFEMAVFSRINDEGMVVDERRYYDVAGQLEQLGLGE